MKKALLVLTLGAFVASAGTAVAGTSFPGVSPGHTVKVATETLTTPLGTFPIPSAPAGQVHRTLSLVPADTSTYTFEANIGAQITDQPQPGVTWVATGGGTPSLANVTLGSTGGGCTTFIPTAIFSSATQYRWSIAFAGCITPPTVDLTFSSGENGNVDVNDGRGTGLPTVPIKMQLRFLDQVGNPIPVETGGETFTFIEALYGTSATVTATTATIDVTSPSAKKWFLPNTDPDTTLTDVGASVTLTTNNTYYDWAGPRDAFFGSGTTTGFYNVILSTPNRDFSGVTVTVGGSTAIGTLTSRNYSFPVGGSGTEAIVSSISGGVTQLAGSFTIAVDYYNGPCAGSTGTTCTSAGTLTHHIPLAVTTYTVWSLNGTVLFAPFVSGNTTAFMQRFYICDPLSVTDISSFDVSIRTVPVNGSFESVPLFEGTINATLVAGGCINIKMEDLLTTVGLPNPYIGTPEISGNLAITMTFSAPNVIGLHQATNSPTLGQPSSFVTAPMIRLNKTSITNPGL